MKRKLPPSADIQSKIDGLLDAETRETTGIEMVGEIAKLGAQLVIQRAVEDEVDQFLGRLRYERKDDALPGKRNGYRPRKLRTAEGNLMVEIPQVREATEPFRSAWFPSGRKLLRTEPLKALVIGSFVRGLSMRDVESLCEEAGLGQISKSSASRICKELRERYRVFCARDLSKIDLVCLFLDAIYLPTRPSGEKEGVICAWGITTAGERVLLSVRLGMHESEEDWMDCGRDLTRRNLPVPLMVASDGAPGLIAASERLWPHSDRQRCTVHRLRNILAKLPKSERDRVKNAYWQALNQAGSRSDGEKKLRALVTELGNGGFTSAAACLADDLEALVVHLKYPLRQRRTWRSTNLLERSLGEVRRRTKVIGRFPGETSCLSLCFAVLDLVVTHANKVNFNDIDKQTIERLRQEQEFKTQMNRATRSTQKEVIAA